VRFSKKLEFKQEKGMRFIEKKRNLLPALMFGSAVMVPTVLAAAEGNHLTLEEILVIDQELQENATAITVGNKTMEKGKNLNIADAIENEPDISISRRAAVGDTADIVSIRGLSSNRIMLNINGRPVNGAGVVGGHYIDWGTIPLDNIEKIEIIRGGSSALYGNNALGGVINVITKKPSDKPEFTVFGNIGQGEDDYTIQNYRFTHSYKVGPLGYSLGGSYQNGDEFLWNNDFTGKNLNLSTNLDMPFDGLLSMGMQYAEADRGFIRNNRQSTDPDNPGFFLPVNPDYPLAFGETIAPGWGNAFVPGPNANWDKTKYYFDFGYQQPIGEALLEFKAYKNYEDRKEKNYSMSGLVAGYGDDTLVLDREVESDRSYGGSLQGAIPMERHEVIAGVEYKVLSFGDITVNYVDNTYNGNVYTGSQPSQEGKMWGYFVQDSWQVTDRLLLTPGLRFDTYRLEPINNAPIAELRDEEWSPKMTGTYTLTEADKVTLSLYQAVRTPGLPEMWWWFNGGTAGNPTLKPEKNSAAEAVFQHDLSNSGYLRVSAYYYDIKDYIMFRFDPNWRGAYNIDKAILHGVSADSRIDLTDWLTMRASLAYQKSKKEGDLFDTAHLTDEIDYLPKWQGNIGADFKLPYHMKLAADLHYVGKREAIYSYSSGWPAQSNFKLVTLDSHMTADLELKTPVTEHGEVSLYVENLFDKTYEERYGYPLPGRIIGVSCKMVF
jgi:iron complex outermembrane receptor protein